MEETFSGHNQNMAQIIGLSNKVKTERSKDDAKRKNENQNARARRRDALELFTSCSRAGGSGVLIFLPRSDFFWLLVPTCLERLQKGTKSERCSRVGEMANGSETDARA